MKKGTKLLGLIVILLIIGSAFVGVVTAEEIIIDTEKGESGFTTDPPRELPYEWWYAHDHLDSSPDGWFDTKAYPPGQGNGNFWYTFSFPEVAEYKGIWETSLIHSGNYEVFVWIPSPDPFDPNLNEYVPPNVYLPTQVAKYKIFHKTEVDIVTIDQDLNKGRFTSLGVFDFGTTARVELTNNQDEFWRSVAFDAVKFVPVAVHDMAVTNVNTVPSSPYVGQSTTIYVTAKNKGRQQENDVPVKAYVDGVQVGSTQYVTLQADKSETKSFSWIPSTAKTYSVKGEVGIVSGETETSDNTKTTSVVVNPVAVHDMAVTNVNTVPSSPCVGQSTTIYVTVKNEGRQQENDVPVKAYVDGVQVGSTQYVTLSADESETKSFSWTPSTAKTYSVKGEVGIVSGETETSDNTKTTSVVVNPVAVHDMAVTNVNTVPSSPYVGQSTTIYVTVKNEGRQQENDVQVKAYVDGVQVGSTQYVTLSADESETKSFSWTPSTAKTYSVKGEVGIVSGETETSDNTKTTSVVVNPVAVHDMAVTNVNTVPSSPYVGQSTTIYVTVKNEGRQQENDVQVKAYVDGVQVGSTQYVTLSADESETKSFSWTPSTAKTYSVKGEVGIVSGETETSDNTKTISVSVSKILTVPYYNQGNTDWCVPTSMSMIFNYYGKNIHSWDIAEEWDWEREISWWDAHWGTRKSKIVKYFNNKGLATKDISLDDFTDMKDSIDNGIPIFIEVSGLEHAVVIVGYKVIEGSYIAYINDPSQILDQEDLVQGERINIAAEVDWNKLTEYLDFGSYAIAVGESPSYPKGTIDICDTVAGFYFHHEGKHHGVYSWRCGKVGGIIWKSEPQLHPLWLDQRDLFKFDQCIANHMENTQTYLFKIDFTKEGYSNSHFVEIAVDGRSRKNNIIEDSIFLRDLLEEEYGEYTVTLTLWDTKLEKKYDEIVFPSIKYTPPDYPGYAIIVAGEGRRICGVPLIVDKKAIDHNANNAYRVLRNLGFDDDHIFYLNSNRPQNIDADEDDEVDAPAFFSDFESAINKVKNEIEDNPTPFILYLKGHGLPSKFMFSESSYLETYQLKGMLDQFSSEIPMLIIVDSCYSGSFINPLIGISSQNRIIITTTHADQERSWVGCLHSSDRLWGNLNNGLDVKEAFTTNILPPVGMAGALFTSDIHYLLLDDNGDGEGHPPNDLGTDGDLAARTQIGVPSTENLKLIDWLFVGLGSPGELRVYDTENRVTGLVNGEVKKEIPDSIYDEQNETVAIFAPSDTYRYEVVGTNEETYELDTASVEGSDTTTFTAIDIPTASGAVHQYTINWTALSQGEKGVTIQIDSDGDGTFEQTIITNNTFHPPVASFYYLPQNPIINQMVTFNASASYDPDGNITNYKWNFGDGNITNTTDPIITHTYVSAGDYTVNLTVTDDDSATDQDTTTLAITEPPIANANGPYAGVIEYIAVPITFDGTGSYDPDGTIIKYAWDLDNDGKFDDAVGATPTVSFTAPGLGNIHLKVTDNTGATDTDTTTLTITKHSPPPNGIHGGLLTPPEQPQCYSGTSTIQGSGYFTIDERIQDWATAIDTTEHIEGTGEFEMASKTVLDQAANPLDFYDPNFYYKKTIQFQGNATNRLISRDKFESSGIFGGTGTRINEYFDVSMIQKDESGSIKTISAPGSGQSHRFATMDDFSGIWGIHSDWQKICQKEIRHHQMFKGNFSVQKDLTFEREIIMP